MPAIERDSGSRPALIGRAFILEWVTLAWVLLEAGFGIWSGLQAHSISLLAFGADSVIELISACVLIWRLTVELHHGQKFSQDAERKASRISGALLLALAMYVVLSAAWGLWIQQGEEFTRIGLAITATTIPVMYIFAKRKIAVAEQIGSRALRADGMESLTCGWLSFVVVIGLLAQFALGAWWIDPVISLAIVYFLVKEGCEAWAGDDCAAHGH